MLNSEQALTNIAVDPDTEELMHLISADVALDGDLDNDFAALISNFESLSNNALFEDLSDNSEDLSDNSEDFVPWQERTTARKNAIKLRNETAIKFEENRKKILEILFDKKTLKIEINRIQYEKIEKIEKQTKMIKRRQKDMLRSAEEMELSTNELEKLHAIMKHNYTEYLGVAFPITTPPANATLVGKMRHTSSIKKSVERGKNEMKKKKKKLAPRNLFSDDEDEEEGEKKDDGDEKDGGGEKGNYRLRL